MQPCDTQTEKGKRAIFRGLGLLLGVDGIKNLKELVAISGKPDGWMLELLWLCIGCFIHK